MHGSLTWAFALPYRRAAVDLAEAGADEAAVAVTAAQLVAQFRNGMPLTEAHVTVLCTFVQQQIDKHQKPKGVASKIIDEDNKIIRLMWGKIKRRYPMGDTFPLLTE